MSFDSSTGIYTLPPGYSANGFPLNPPRVNNHAVNQPPYPIGTRFRHIGTGEECEVTHTDASGIFDAYIVRSLTAPFLEFYEDEVTLKNSYVRSQEVVSGFSSAPRDGVEITEYFGNHVNEELGKNSNCDHSFKPSNSVAGLSQWCSKCDERK